VYPAAVLVPLRLAYSRACEYTCDIMGRQMSSEKGIIGLVMLAAGKKLSRIVNIQEYVQRGIYLTLPTMALVAARTRKLAERHWVDGNCLLQ
jgi:Zn-dependent protease with chaperone function